MKINNVQLNTRIYHQAASVRNDLRIKYSLVNVVCQTNKRIHPVNVQKSDTLSSGGPRLGPDNAHFHRVEAKTEQREIGSR